MTSAYIEEASERAKHARFPLRVVPNPDPSPGEARILTHVQVHGSYLLVSERLGDLLAFASRLQAEVNKMREAAGK